MLVELLDGAISKIESRDVIFLKMEFQRKGGINDNDRLFLKWMSYMKALLILIKKMRVAYCLMGVHLRVGVYH